jgi:predicted DNA-binding protein with PD1-like motif
MRSILHPGEVAAERVQVLPAAVKQVELTLAPGHSLLAALTDALAPYGASSAVLSLAGGAFFPFAYVMPATSKTPDHAVYYSERFDAVAPVQLEFAAVTYGQRNGQPWLHCHATWIDAEGSRRCGHVLPDAAIMTAPLRASVCILDGAEFHVRPDAETNFSLFKPQATARRLGDPSAPEALVVRLSPNVDVCTALEDICREHGISNATIQGGVGSLVGAAFDDGRSVEPFVTEVLIRAGRVRVAPHGALRAEVDVAMVDFTGHRSAGRLMRGANPVLVTFELVLLPAPQARSTAR